MIREGHKYSDKSFVTFQNRLFGGLADSESAVGSRQFRGFLLPTAYCLLLTAYYRCSGLLLET
jgi:hypothetical protein